jgi:hypothetical protein
VPAGQADEARRLLVELAANPPMASDAGGDDEVGGDPNE